jgi:molecular chaperone DnaJ
MRTGRGEVEREESVTVKVSPRDRGGHGGCAWWVADLISADGKSPAGDLLVVDRSRPDPRSQRDGANLWRAEHVEMPEAVLGATREVLTLDGPLTKVKTHPGLSLMRC